MHQINSVQVNNAMAVISSSHFCKWAILQSNFHTVFVWKYGSTMKTDLRYTPSDVYETFPFPVLPMTKEEYIEQKGKDLFSLRQSVLTIQQIGLTLFYKNYHNRANNQDEILKARKIQQEIDLAVRDAYGWNDIDLEHGFHAVGYLPENDNIRYTISEAARVEILKRLAKLNHDRWEAEQRNG